MLRSPLSLVFGIEDGMALPAELAQQDTDFRTVVNLCALVIGARCGQLENRANIF